MGFVLIGGRYFDAAVADRAGVDERVRDQVAKVAGNRQAKKVVFGERYCIPRV